MIHDVGNKGYKEAIIIRLELNRPFQAGDLIHNASMNKMFMADQKLRNGWNTMEDKGDHLKPQHLYFICDDDIEVGNFVYDSVDQVVFKVLEKGHAGLLRSNSLSYVEDSCSKIIATTDPEMLALLSCNGIQREGESCRKNENCTYANCRLPQPSIDFLELYCKQGGFDTVLLELNHPHDGCVINWKKKTFERTLLVNKDDNTVSIFPMEILKTYSTQEVEKIIKKSHDAITKYKKGYAPTSTEIQAWIDKNLYNLNE